MVTKNFIIKNSFYDSVILMQIATKIKETSHIEQISVLMATESNKDLMKETKLLCEEGKNSSPNDLIIAVKASDKDEASKAFETVKKLLTERDIKKKEKGKEQMPKTIEKAVADQPLSNMALISLPGPFVRYEAEKALDFGLNVFIFSDNVPIEDEIFLKKKAEKLGFLVMGPDCGTSIIKGRALGFANIVKSGSVGIVGASGTGIQEITVLLSNHGIGISHAIGTGSRDLSKEVGGITMLSGMTALEKDPKTDYILLVSKPPDKKVSKLIIENAKKIKKPVIINFLNADESLISEKKILFAATLEEAVYRTISVVKNKPYKKHIFTENPSVVMKKAESCWKNLKDPGQKYIRALYSGGTLCEESIVILRELIGEIHSNTNATPANRLKDARKSDGNCLVDLGDDEFTRGKPHPMIDYTQRKERISFEARDKEVAVILLDIVIGYGSHTDPSSELVPVITEALRNNKHIIFVASVCGTNEDPQSLKKQEKSLGEAGIILMPSNAEAARFAALVATRGKCAEKMGIL